MRLRRQENEAGLAATDSLKFVGATLRPCRTNVKRCLDFSISVLASQPRVGGASLARQEEQGAILWRDVKISLAILQRLTDLACLFPPYNPIDAATN
jgi:hypothetical protein